MSVRGLLKRRGVEMQFKVARQCKHKVCGYKIEIPKRKQVILIVGTQHEEIKLNVRIHILPNSTP